MKLSNLHVLVDTQTREYAYSELVRRVSTCSLCPRMDGRTRVLGTANGNLRAKLLFVAEAPGRLGAEISGIPLHGDQTGRNFQKLLDHSGINRDEVFITNAVLCNPRDENDRNTTPIRIEINQCSVHLRAVLEVVQPEIVVALGNIALNALKIVEYHTASLAQGVGKPIVWNGRWLVPLYHPGPRARLHRPLIDQQNDFTALAQMIRN